MKLFSPRNKPLSRATARNAAFLNLLAWPGLGSLLGRRWIAGTGQLVMFLAGFILFCDWAYQTLNYYYQQADFSAKPPPPSAGHWGNLAWAGVALCLIGWIWSAVTSVSLLREASTAKERALKNFAAPPVQKMAEAKIPQALVSVPNWKLSGATIVRTFQFNDFPAAIKFVDTVAVLAEQAWHHPDIDIRWNKVTLTLSTHDAGGLTEKDFALARQFDKV